LAHLQPGGRGIRLQPNDLVDDPKTRVEMIGKLARFLSGADLDKQGVV